MSLATAILPHTVYQDSNRHTTIVSHIEGTKKIVVKHVAMCGSLDLVGTPLDSFVEQFPSLMDYDAVKAARTYLAATAYVPCSEAARVFLTHLSEGTEMPIKTVSADSTTPAAAPAAAPAPVAAKKAPVAAKKAPAVKTAAAPAPAAEAPAAAPAPVAAKKAPATKKVATKTVEAPAAAPAAAAPATKKVAAKKTTDKPAKVSAADKKAAADAEEGKQVITLVDAAKCVTAVMKEMAAFLGKKPEGITFAKVVEKFSKERNVGVTKMNLKWGARADVGAFKINGKYLPAPK